MISLILPVYNQADHIARVVGEYRSVMESLSDYAPSPGTPGEGWGGGFIISPSVPLSSPPPEYREREPHEHSPQLSVTSNAAGDYEIVLVPNGCRDDSVAVCESLAGKNVRVISSVAGGWGRAVNLGLQSANGDLLCYTNSARTPADDLVAVLKVAIERPDAVVKAIRRVREGWRRWLGSKLYNAECRLLLGTRSDDVNGTPKAFSRGLATLLNLTRQDDLIDAELLAVAARQGYPVVEVPVGARQRHGGASTTKFKSAWKMYRGVFALRKLLREGVAA